MRSLRRTYQRGAITINCEICAVLPRSTHVAHRSATAILCDVLAVDGVSDSFLVCGCMRGHEVMHLRGWRGRGALTDYASLWFINISCSCYFVVLHYVMGTRRPFSLHIPGTTYEVRSYFLDHALIVSFLLQADDVPRPPSPPSRIANSKPPTMRPSLWGSITFRMHTSSPPARLSARFPRQHRP